MPPDPEVAVALDEAVAREGEEARLEYFRYRAQVGMLFPRGGPAVEEVEDAVGALEEGDEGEGAAAREFGEALLVHCDLCNRLDWGWLGMRLWLWQSVSDYEMVGRSGVTELPRGRTVSSHV